jgi:uncharacterized protein
MVATWFFWWLLSYFTRAGMLSIDGGLGLALYILGGSAPTIGAYIAVLKTKDAGSVSEYNSRVFSYRHSYYYYLYAIGVPLLLGLGGLAIVYLIDAQSMPGMDIKPLVLFIPAFFSAIFFGGLEEFGWRGIFQHEMKGKLSLFKMNLVIGMIWGLWHLPLFFVVGTSHEGNSFLFFALAGIGYSAFLTWLYAKTESILLCVFFHASINAVATVGLYVPMSESGLYPFFALFVLLAGLIFIKATEKYLTK